ncbi:MAG TPA: UDP-N-acetylmuramoyl-L-alanine--D-glutamate ligase [Elusimicrobia bacterium]|nr:UDP-N-acetylmuramoyl-L-alanine--D-glutamate ligase [Elusimicrobiota bacterium]HBT60836.1 UDP-N-acetylmuramoyl-L-alanine--D-glutamate ligase [Elusimicrobiota bacterium]
MKFEPKAFRKKKASVLGLGKSGVAAARLLRRKGFAVFGSDLRPRAQVKSALGRLAGAMAWEGGGHGERVLKAGFAVKSPGLPSTAPILSRLRAAGVPVFSEMEIGLAFCPKAELVAITGTNGKTTTTALTAEIFRQGLPRGRKAHLAGNIGVPLCDKVLQVKPKDVLVIEVSSYQLEDSRSLRPRAAALLNLTADHVDHHGSMLAYIEAKARLFREQKEGDFCVFNAEDPLVFKLSRRCRCRRLYFGRKGGYSHAWVDEGRIKVRLPGQKEVSFTPPALPGTHNLENAMAAVLLGLGWGIKPQAIQKALRVFRGVPHRLEEAGAVHGIRCVNDSKATNVDSTMVALKTFSKKNVLLIMGGLHKGSPYKPLRPLIESVVKGILTVGSASGKIEEDLGGLAPIFPCGDLETAIRTALQIGAPGDVLLLSPACASFDQFRNFEDRGDRFKALVKAVR